MIKILNDIKKSRIISKIFDDLIIDYDEDGSFHYYNNKHNYIIWLNIENNSILICPDDIEELLGVRYDCGIHEIIMKHLGYKYTYMICYIPKNELNYVHTTFEEYERDALCNKGGTVYQ